MYAIVVQLTETVQSLTNTNKQLHVKIDAQKEKLDALEASIASTAALITETERNT